MNPKKSSMKPLKYSSLSGSKTLQSGGDGIGSGWNHSEKRGKPGNSTK